MVGSGPALGKFSPSDAVEEGLIEEMCAAYWRMRRAWSIENELLVQELDPDASKTHRARAAAAFRKLAGAAKVNLPNEPNPISGHSPSA